jgi:TetR/AcrR family transcriptional regulator
MDTSMFLTHENAGRILEEGWTLFQQKGYRGVTIDELCQRCGITKPTLYYYFQDKENLFVQVMVFKLHGFREVIDQPGKIADRLTNIAKIILVSFQTEYSSLMRDREFLKRPDNFQRIRNAFHQELFDPLIHLMQLEIEHGVLQGDNPRMLALIFLGIINNFIGKNSEMDLDNQHLAQELTNFFLSGAKK